MAIEGLRTSSPALPGTPPAPSGTKKARFEIEDEDLDELVHSIPDSSPYFTQPTQIVNRTTQPTQIVNRATQPTQVVELRTTLQRSSPPIPDTPGSVIEVPASSPFRSLSQRKRPGVFMQSQAAKTGRLASMMAPAGTAFQAPAGSLPRRPQPAIKRQYLSSRNSDDDLANDYKRQDSSDDDETPMRGEIKPSAFVRKPPSAVAVPRPSLIEDKDISPNDIPDLRLRYLTKQVYKCVVTSKPGVLYRHCRDELQNNGMSIGDATATLLGETRTIPPVPKAPSDSRSKSYNEVPRKTIDNEQQPKPWSQAKLPPAQKPRAPSSSPPSPEPAKNVAPRRRLIKGRRNQSPSPDKVFSVSSSHANSSTATSSVRSSPEKSGSMAIAAVTVGDREPQRSEVIVVDSDSDDDDDFPSLAKIAAAEKKRKLTSTVDSPVVKKRGRLMSRGEKLTIKADPQLSMASAQPKVVDLSDSDTFAREDESDESGHGSHVHMPTKEHENVLAYLNSCTPEALARMTSSTAKDSQLVVSKRPFQHISDVEKIKAKGTKRSKAGDIGSNMIGKLDTWFKAFDAVTTVINNCATRGNQLKSIMAKWEMDTNGNIKATTGEDGDPNTTRDHATSSQSTFKPLPIPERPELMAVDVELKSYQQFGLNWMNLLHKLGYSAILADDMGLGKTCQVISFISHLVKTKPSAKPHLIVVPPSTLENWANEFTRFAPVIKIHLYSGTFITM